MIKFIDRPLAYAFVGWMQVIDPNERMQEGYVVLRNHKIHPTKIAEREDSGDTTHNDGFEIHALNVTPKAFEDMERRAMEQRLVQRNDFSVWKRDRQAPPAPIAQRDAIIPKKDRFHPQAGIPNWAGYSQMYQGKTVFRKGMVVLYGIIPGNGPNTIQDMKLDAKIGFVVDGPVAGLDGCTIEYFRDNFCPNRTFTVWRKKQQEEEVVFAVHAGIAERNFDAFIEQLYNPKKKPFTPKIEKNKFHSKPLPLP